MRADLEKLAQVISSTTGEESRAAGLAEADAGLVEQRRNRLRRIADEMGDLPAREALWHYARSVGDMHGEIESEMQASVEQRIRGESDAAKELADLGGQVPEGVLVPRHWLDENHHALESSNAYVERQGLPLAPDDSVANQVRADYARMEKMIADLDRAVAYPCAQARIRKPVRVQSAGDRRQDRAQRDHPPIPGPAASQ